MGTGRTVWPFVKHDNVLRTKVSEEGNDRVHEVLGKVQSAFNQAYEELTNSAASQLFMWWVSGWAEITPVPFFFFCYENLECIYLILFFSKETFTNANYRDSGFTYPESILWSSTFTGGHLC